jgi:hypothetical protein
MYFCFFLPDNMNPETNSLLKEEYFHLQKVIEDFDNKTLTIKTWSISGSLVIIGAALTDKGTKELFLVASIASSSFWIIEAYWKAFQLSYYGRIKAIENHFLSPEKSELKPLQLYSAWGVSWKKYTKKQLFCYLFWPSVMLPHIILAAGGIIIYALLLSNVFHLRHT